MANEFVFYKKDIENIFVSLVFEELQSDYGDAMCNGVTSGILNNSTLSDEKKAIYKERFIRSCSEVYIYDYQKWVSGKFE